MVQGLQRAVIGTGVPGSGPAPWVEAEIVEEPLPTDRTEQLAGEYKAVVESILEHRGVPGLADALRGLTDPSQVADVGGYSPDLSLEQKVEILETVDIEARLEKVLGWAKETLAELVLKDRIRQDVADGMDQTQREFLLRQQLAAIRKELGEDGDADELIQGYRDKAESKGCRRRFARRSFGRSTGWSGRPSRTSSTDGSAPGSTPSPRSRGVRCRDDVDIATAQEILGADHTGLDDVKERIVEYLAVRERRAERGDGEPTGRGSGAILTLVGHPAWGRRRSASPWLGPWAAPSCRSRSAGSATRPRSAGIAAPTSVRCRAGSCGRSPRRGDEPRAPARRGRQGRR